DRRREPPVPLSKARLIWTALTAATLLLSAGTVIAATAAGATAAPQATAQSAHTVTFDNYSFKVDGQRVYLWSGEFHYFRLPSPDLSLDIFQKMKAAGFNATSLYFDWGYHSPAPGMYDFAGVLDVDGPDAYPQGFNCSNPTRWNGVPDISYDHPAGRPLYSPEFQGGAFDPWGGPGYDKCAQLINDQFANVFYKQNIAVGATA